MAATIIPTPAHLLCFALRLLWLTWEWSKWRNWQCLDIIYVETSLGLHCSNTHILRSTNRHRITYLTFEQEKVHNGASCTNFTIDYYTVLSPSWICNNQLDCILRECVAVFWRPLSIHDLFLDANIPIHHHSPHRLHLLLIEHDWYERNGGQESGT